MVPVLGFEPRFRDSESRVLPVRRLRMDGTLGFEPRLTVSKAALLPLEDTPLLVTPAGFDPAFTA